MRRVKEATTMATSASAPAKLRGTIKTIKKTEGYGFITHSATGEDHFFHRSAVERTSPIAFDDLEVDQEVEFIPVEGPKGARAIQVKPL
jgi:CspA family cold shock protein